MEVEGEVKRLHRKQSLYQSLDEKFQILQTEKYRGQQYSQIYFARLHHMRNLIYTLVPNWKPDLPAQGHTGCCQNSQASYKLESIYTQTGVRSLKKGWRYKA